MNIIPYKGKFESKHQRIIVVNCRLKLHLEFDNDKPKKGLDKNILVLKNKHH